MQSTKRKIQCFFPLLKVAAKLSGPPVGQSPRCLIMSTSSSSNGRWRQVYGTSSIQQICGMEGARGLYLYRRCGECVLFKKNCSPAV